MATDPMALVNALNSNQDPSVYYNQLQAQQQQDLAQALLKQGITPMTGTESVGGVAIRRSPLEGAAKLAALLSGQSLQGQANDKTVQGMMQQAQALRYAMGADQGSQQGGQAPQMPPQGQPAPPQGQGPGMPPPQGGMPPQMPPGQPPAQPGGMGAYRLPGMNPQQALLSMLQDPKGYNDAFLKGFTPNDTTIAARQAGVDPAVANRLALIKNSTDPKILGMQQAGMSPEMVYQAIYGEAAKNAEIDRKVNNQFSNPLTGESGQVPKLSDNANPVGRPGPNGAIPGVAPIPGSVGVVGGLQAAETRAKTNESIHTATNPDGSTSTGRGATLFPETGGRSPDTIRAQIEMVRSNGGQPIDPKDQPAIDREVARLQGLLTNNGVIKGPSSTDASIQKSAADTIAAAPQTVAQSRSAITGLQTALQQLESGAKSGPGTAKSVNALALLNNMGVPLLKGDVDGYQTLQKYLQNSLNAAAQGTGASGSDARFESFMHGQPNAETMNPTALKGAIRYVLSQHDAAIARGQFLQQTYQQAADRGDPRAALTAQKAWSDAYKPDFFAFNRMDPAEQASYLRQKGGNAKTFVNQYNDYAAKTGWVH